MYLAFVGPFNEVGQYPWDMGGIAGIRRFLERVWVLRGKLQEGSAVPPHVILALHQTIKKVGEDIEAHKFNTAISQLMIFVNILDAESSISRSVYSTMLRLLAPFAPHLSEELWELLGEKSSIHLEAWPVYDMSVLENANVTIAVQVNGKTRGTFEAPRDTTEANLKIMAKTVQGVEAHLQGKAILREVVVPGRLVNFVVKAE